jgi:pimeloyl-ACP methyl ester carboxylesterase
VATYILVSGAWHAGWCWERLTPLLEARGHRAIAPDLLGMGPDRTPLAEVGLARWADQVADLVSAQAEPVVLVGHSRSGIVISEVAERVPGAIHSLVYLAAMLIPSGDSMMTVLAPLLAGSENQMEIRPDGTSVIPRDLVAPTFYNTTPADWAARAADQLTPEPMVVFATPLSLTSARFGAVRRAYIECTEDRAVPLALQRAMQAALPCDPVIALETDHSPFFSAPERLAEALEVIATAHASKI